MSCKVVGVPEERVGVENIGVSAREASLGQLFPDFGLQGPVQLLKK